jgi:hypothetical protein
MTPSLENSVDIRWGPKELANGISPVFAAPYFETNPILATDQLPQGKT